MPDDRLLHRRAGHGEKVTGLSSDEFRVWTQYLLSADDFGVMRCSPTPIRDGNTFLDSKPERQVARWLEAVIASDLIQTFEHQGRRYVYQRDWQSWQKVKYPRATTHPCPPPDVLATCDGPTQRLFALYPGGHGRKVTERFDEDSGNGSENVSETVPQGSSTTRACGPAKRLTLTANANASANANENANGSEIGRGGPTRCDLLFEELIRAYPEHRRSRSAMGMHAFAAAVGGPDGIAVFDRMMANLRTQLTGEQWSQPRMVPMLDKWLMGKLWQQVHEPPKPAPSREPQWVLEARARKAADGGC